mmetsp:Transcript_46409/g.84970  ORF Transcript_46409/g.84970 Transcript_46409/m.84970 type:complete len:221 (+) Transcript_46409:131-793(+)
MWHLTHALLAIASLSLAQRGGRWSAVPMVAEAAYFHVHEGEEKCFMENVPEGQVLTVKYRHIENPGVECKLVFKNPQNTEVHSKVIASDQLQAAQAAYMAKVAGEHRICIQCQGSKWFQTTVLKWELSVDMGDTSFFRSPATAGEVQGVQKTIMSTLARAEAISAENEYEKSTEMDFRNMSERVNSHIVGVSVFIMVIEMGLCVWQIMHLRDFFRREKLF